MHGIYGPKTAAASRAKTTREALFQWALGTKYIRMIMAMVDRCKKDMRGILGK